MLVVLAVAVHVQAPTQLAPWEPATAKVIVENRGATPIVPLALELESARGTIAAWGTQARCQGTVDDCYIQTQSWAIPALARQQGNRWELLLGQPPPQQVAAPPDPLTSQASASLLRLAPIAPGAKIELDAAFVAAYQHGGTLEAKLRYVEIGSALATCAPTARPSKPTFVACAPAKSGELYASEADASRLARQVAGKQTFVVAHPAFDVDRARARAKLATGDFAYDRGAQRWILVDDARTRTLVVGERGPIDDLPGDWLRLLGALDPNTETSVFWNAANAQDAKAIESRAKQAKLSISGFSFKGRPDPLRFRVAIRRTDVASLAATMRALGYRMTRYAITK